jgi:hypothetical protein
MSYLSEPSFLFALISLVLDPLLWPFWAFVPLSVVSAARLWRVKYPSIEIGPLGLADAVTHHARQSPSGLSDFHWPSNARMTLVYALLFVLSIFAILARLFSPQQCPQHCSLVDMDPDLPGSASAQILRPFC